MQIPTRTASSHKRGFTLIELIVVIAIVATLLSVGIGTLKNTASSKGVSTGVSIAQGVFENARNQAKSRGRARVVIYADTEGSNKDLRERYLKFMAVIIPDLKDGETYDEKKTYTWLLTSSGTTLPKDTFFNSNLSNAELGSSPFPGSQTSKKCFYYEFNSEGGLSRPLLAKSDANPTPAPFIIQLGTIKPGQETPKAFPTRKKDAGGFAVWKNGKISIYRSIKQINSGNVKF